MLTFHIICLSSLSSFNISWNFIYKIIIEIYIINNNILNLYHLLK